MKENVDIRHLRYFLAVASELNFGRAAECLHISQPPLSRQIRQLENELGVDLFHRTANGVVLTRAGEAFLPEARRALTQVEKAVAAAGAARSAQGGQFVMGYTTVFDRSALPDVSERLQKMFPDLQIAVKGRHSISLIRDIRNGVMDAAFIGLHTEAKGLEVSVIREEPLVAAMPSRHRLATKRSVSFGDLENEPLFWFERRLNPGFYDHCQSFFDRIGFSPRTLPEPPDHHILLGLIAEGQGIALIPQSLQTVRRKGVAFRRLKGDTGLSAGIAVAYSAQNVSPALRAFLRLVQKAGR